jgi:hypothetical protein
MSLIVVHPLPDGSAATTHLSPPGTPFSRQPNPDRGPRPSIEKPKPGSKVLPRPGRETIVPQARSPEAEAKALLGENATFRVVDDSTLPDPYFRDAWVFDPEKGAVVHPGRAKAIHAANLRRARKPLLEALDVEFMRAQEQGLPTGAIVARKQALRDVTNNLPEDLAALKAVTLPA